VNCSACDYKLSFVEVFSISGYNITVLAYGQTGFGKTYSMGTAYTGDGSMGVITRAINDIFDAVKETENCDFRIMVSFVEVNYTLILYILTDKDACVCV
jgi:kinesin family protein 4/21/27